MTTPQRWCWSTLTDDVWDDPEGAWSPRATYAYDNLWGLNGFPDTALDEERVVALDASRPLRDPEIIQLELWLRAV